MGVVSRHTSPSDHRMDSSFILACTDWTAKPKFVLRQLVRTQAAARRSLVKRQGTIAARRLLERLGL